MFKAGDWIVRKWKWHLNDRIYDDVDFVKFKTDINNSAFLADDFFRFGKNFGKAYKVEELTRNKDFPLPYKDKDGRMEYDWRLATEKEKEEYFLQLITIEPNPFNI